MSGGVPKGSIPILIGVWWNEGLLISYDNIFCGQQVVGTGVAVKLLLKTCTDKVFQGEGHCGKVKGQSVTKSHLCTHPNKDESVYRI